VWRRGVNGSALWDRLCPSVSLPADPPAQVAAAMQQPVPSSSPAEQLWGLPEDDTSDDGSGTLISCIARYDLLLNGFSGE
jgi:hypothetical protein